MSLMMQAVALMDMKKKGKITDQQYKDKMYRLELQTANGPRGLVNISKVPTSIEWYIDERIADNKVSVAEKLIAGILDQYRLEYYQEVSMYGIVLPTGGCARYDFLLKIGNPYIILEYDGVLSHSSDYQRKRDALKTRWCKDRGIVLYRYSREHYYHMESILQELLHSYKVYKKK